MDIVCQICIFINITDYAYEYKDVLPEVSALEMLRYGPGGGLPVKDEFDLQTVDRLRYQKMQSDNLPSVEESKRALVQNRLLGMKISKEGKQDFEYFDIANLHSMRYNP